MNVTDDDKATLGQDNRIIVLRKQPKRSHPQLKRRYAKTLKRPQRLHWRLVERRVNGMRRLDDTPELVYSDLPSNSLPGDDNLTLPNSDKAQSIAKYYVLQKASNDKAVVLERWPMELWEKAMRGQKPVEPVEKYKTGVYFNLLKSLTDERAIISLLYLVRDEIIKLNNLHPHIVKNKDVVLSDNWLAKNDCLA